MSRKMASPSPGSTTGLWIHLRMAGGIQASLVSMTHCGGSLARNADKLPLESSSATIAPAVEHRVILSTVNVQPMAAAMRPMAVTMVVHSAQLVLYPFRHTPMDPALSTQTLTGASLQYFLPALMQTSGPTSSSADSFLLSCFPSAARSPSRTPSSCRTRW
jgi:hypothetical protein